MTRFGKTKRGDKAAALARQFDLNSRELAMAYLQLNKPFASRRSWGSILPCFGIVLIPFVKAGYGLAGIPGALVGAALTLGSLGYSFTNTFLLRQSTNNFTKNNLHRDMAVVKRAVRNTRAKGPATCHRAQT